MKKTILFLAFSLNGHAQEGPPYCPDDYVQKKIEQAVVVRLKKLGQSQIVNYSKELMKKEYELNLREKELDHQTVKIQQNEQQLAAKMKEFRKEQDSFLACLNDVNKDKQKRVKRMVQVLSGMKADAAAQVLSVQEPAIAVELLRFLEPERVSKIFNKMEKEVSARLQRQFLNVRQ